MLKYLERRKCKRFQSRFPIHFLKKMKDITTNQIKQLGFAANISKTGICLLTINKLDIGDVLDLTLSLPCKNQTQKISVTGIVRWGQSITNKPSSLETKSVWSSDFTFCNGIEFMDYSNKTNIHSFIDYLQSLVA